MIVHDKKNEKSIVLDYIIALVPLIIFGLYKNGYLMYQKNLISLSKIFYPLIYSLISILGYTLYILGKEKHFQLNYEFINFLVFSLMISWNTNIYIYTIMVIFLVIISFFKKEWQFSEVSLLKLLMTGFFLGNFNYNYANTLELNYNYSYNYWDILLGHQIGPWAGTSFIFLIWAFIYLSYRKSIKSLIPLVSYLCYFLLIGGDFLINKKFDFNFLFNANVLFAFIFVASNNFHSPNTKMKKIIYSGFIGILAALFSKFLSYYDGVYLAILIGSILLNFSKIKIKLPKNKGNKA